MTARCQLDYILCNSVAMMMLAVKSTTKWLPTLIRHGRETAVTDDANRFLDLENRYLHVFRFGSTLILVPARPPP